MAAAFALATVVVALPFLRAAIRKHSAHAAAAHMGMAGRRLVLVDAQQGPKSPAYVPQPNIGSERYGISGRPDRVIATENGYAPVEVKSSVFPVTGPYVPRLCAKRHSNAELMNTLID